MASRTPFLLSRFKWPSVTYDSRYRYQSRQLPLDGQCKGNNEPQESWWSNNRASWSFSLVAVRVRVSFDAFMLSVVSQKGIRHVTTNLLLFGRSCTNLQLTNNNTHMQHRRTVPRKCASDENLYHLVTKVFLPEQVESTEGAGWRAGCCYSCYYY